MGFTINFCRKAEVGISGRWTVPEQFAQHGGTALIRMFIPGEDWRDPEHVENIHQWIHRTQGFCARYRKPFEVQGAVRIDDGWVVTGKPSPAGFDRQSFFLRQSREEWLSHILPWLRKGGTLGLAKPIDRAWAGDDRGGNLVWWVGKSASPLSISLKKALMDITSSDYLHWVLSEIQAWQAEFRVNGIDWGLKSDFHRNLQKSRFGNDLIYATPETAAEMGSGHMQPLRVTPAQFESSHNWMMKQFTKEDMAFSLNASGAQELRWIDDRWAKACCGVNTMATGYKDYLVTRRPW